LVRADAEARLKAGWTPEIIGKRARRDGRPWVCKETIYKHIYADAKCGGTLWKNLPRARRKRRRRCPRQEGRGRGKIPNQRMIDTRPAEVETRQTIGHWEGDLINGAQETGNLVVLVERNTRFSLIGRTASKEAEEVMREIRALFAPLPQVSRLSLTVDNGKEFARHEELSRTTRMDVFFARPYHSWERGTNENTNGLIRRLHPKKSSFAGIGETELKRIDTFLNDRPRKCLGWMTPREKMAAFLAHAP
jgi:IS30 family transposase